MRVSFQQNTSYTPLVVLHPDLRVLNMLFQSLTLEFIHTLLLVVGNLNTAIYKPWGTYLYFYKFNLFEVKYKIYIGNFL